MGGGWELRKIEGLYTSLEKSEFPVFLETENSHWLKADKSVITLTMADHGCIRLHFAACNGCHHRGIFGFFLK